MQLQRAAKLIARSETVRDVVWTTIREAAPLLGAAAAGLELHNGRGRPIVAVDVGVPPPGAALYLKEQHATDAQLARIRETHAVVAMRDVTSLKRYRAEIAGQLGQFEPAMARFADQVGAPLVARGALIGAIRAIPQGEITPAFRDAIGALALHVSAQLAHLGLPLPSVRARIEALPARQRAIVRLCARGHDDAAIAAELGVAVKTVRRELKLVLAKLDVTRRAELAALVGRSDDWIDGYASLDDLPDLNVTRYAGGKIVRSGPWPHVAMPDAS